MHVPHNLNSQHHIQLDCTEIGNVLMVERIDLGLQPIRECDVSNEWVFSLVFSENGKFPPPSPKERSSPMAKHENGEMIF